MQHTSLPRSDRLAPDAVESSMDGTTSQPERRLHSHDRPRILCIDDDAELSRAIGMRLRPFEVDFAQAFLGTQGLWEALTHRTDLILMDLAMPNGDGRFVLESLKANPTTRSVPVIVVTGMRDPRLRSDILGLGADEFLTKPVPFDHLIDHISRYVDLPGQGASTVP